MFKNKKIVLIEQDDEWVKISPEEYLEIMKFASYNATGVKNLPKFRNKKIWITGNLTLRGLPIDSLDGVEYVEGNLDITSTNIKDISKINVKGSISDWNSGVSRIREKRIRDKKIAESNERREEGEWDLDNPNIDEIGLKANTLIQQLGYQGEDVRSEEDNQKLLELKAQLDNLLEREKEVEERGGDMTDIYSDIETIEEQIEEINDKIDVYCLVPDGTHYDMTQFIIICSGDLNDREYAVGTDDEAHDSCVDRIKDMISEGVQHYFREDLLEYHIDEEAVLDYFRDFYENDIWENPDVYFSDDDYELSDEQEKQIELLQSKIEELEKRQNNLEHEIEEPSEYSDAYDKVQEEIDRLEEEIEEITPDTDEPTQDMIDDKVEDMIRGVKRDIVGHMKDFGMEIKYYLDEDSLIDDIISQDGYGMLNSYDGEYDEQTLELPDGTNTNFIIMRVR
jgi:hypothetical protein